MASGTTVFTPPDEANIMQMPPGLPSGAPQQVQQKGPLERFFKAEPKVLGTVQILIGLMHIGFGGLSLCLFLDHYFSVSAAAGYPFWGGILYISSGSVCVAAANSSNRRLVKSSVGLNITCAVMALIGIMLYMCEVIISISAFNPSDGRRVGYGLSVMLFFFSMLEFCIAVSLGHFGCQATCK